MFQVEVPSIGWLRLQSNYGPVTLNGYGGETLHLTLNVNPECTMFGTFFNSALLDSLISVSMQPDCGFLVGTRDEAGWRTDLVSQIPSWITEASTQLIRRFNLTFVGVVFRSKDIALWKNNWVEIELDGFYQAINPERITEIVANILARTGNLFHPARTCCTTHWAAFGRPV